MSKGRKVAMASAALGIAVGSAAIAGAASNDSTTPKQGTAPAPRQGQAPPRHPGEEALSGQTAEKVREAALAKVPGATIIRVETDSDGSPYEAHVRKSDGTLVTVKVDKQFKATAVEPFGPRAGGGPHPPASGSSNGSGSSGMPGSYPGSGIQPTDSPA